MCCLSGHNNTSIWLILNRFKIALCGSTFDAQWLTVSHHSLSPNGICWSITLAVDCAIDFWHIRSKPFNNVSPIVWFTFTGFSAVSRVQRRPKRRMNGTYCDRDRRSVNYSMGKKCTTSYFKSAFSCVNCIILFTLYERLTWRAAPRRVQQNELHSSVRICVYIWIDPRSNKATMWWYGRRYVLQCYCHN